MPSPTLPQPAPPRPVKHMTAVGLTEDGTQLVQFALEIVVATGVTMNKAIELALRGFELARGK